MFPDISSRYHAELIAEREHVAQHGSFRDKVRYDLVPRPYYAFGLLAAADIARFSGINRITAIEFGVAEGKGLLNLCELATLVTAETGVAFDVLGFDTGAGLPALDDHRDHPEIWSAGDFAGVDKAALEAKIKPHGRMVWGDVRDTLRAETFTSPVGFVANDLDLYSSTIASLALFDLASDLLLPVVINYFDDTLGSPNRIGSLFRNRWCGQLAAIDDFNATRSTRKIDSIRTLKARRPLAHELWLDQIYAMHTLDHPLRQVGALRPSLKMDAHARDDIMAWPL